LPASARENGSGVASPPAFFFERLGGRVAQWRRGAARKTFMPFSPR
jgi:hypothetical protein